MTLEQSLRICIRQTSYNLMLLKEKKKNKDLSFYKDKTPFQKNTMPSFKRFFLKKRVTVL